MSPRTVWRIVEAIASDPSASAPRWPTIAVSVRRKIGSAMSAPRAAAPAGVCPCRSPPRLAVYRIAGEARALASGAARASAEGQASGDFEESRGSLPAADAHRHDDVLDASALAFDKGMADEAGPGHPVGWPTEMPPPSTL